MASKPTVINKAYNTRARATQDVGRAQVEERLDADGSQSTPSRPESPVFMTPRRLYSDITASRPASPDAHKEIQSPVPAAGAKEIVLEKDLNNIQLNNPSSSELSDVPNTEDEYPGQWTKVQRRRSALKSAKKAKKAKKAAESKYLKTIKEAEKNLTPADKEKINARFQNTRVVNNNETSDSRGEGPSQDKGKGVDPRNWGALSDNESINVDAQRVAFESFKQDKAVKKNKKEKRKKKEIPSAYTAQSISTAIPPARVVKSARPEVLRAATQINPQSYIGVTMNKIQKQYSNKKHGKRPKVQSSSSSSSSGSSSSSSSPSSSSGSGTGSTSSTSSSGSSRSTNSRRHKRRRSGSSRKRSRSHSKPKSRKKHGSGINKSFRPTNYDGTPDVQLYNRFVRESKAYIEDNRIKSKRRPFALSLFMKGKAYDFFEQKVSINEEEWSLPDFYLGLYDYCFPLTFRLQQRRKLDKFIQKDRTVADFKHQLEQLFNIIGTISEQDKVLKFWRGCKPQIQKALWLEKLHPEKSSWKTVTEAAERFEMADSAANSFMDSLEGGSSSHRNRTHDKRRDNTKSHYNKDDKESTNGGPRNHTGPRRSDNRGRFRRHDRQRGSNSNNDRRQESNKRPQSARLSDKEVAERKAAGLCFVCNEPGHISRNCPKNHTVRSNNNGKPPGFVNHNIKLDTVQEEPELLDGLPLGAIGIESEDYYLQIDENIDATNEIGNLMMDTMNMTLKAGVPYPGDRRNSQVSTPNHRRFRIRQGTRSSDKFYYIKDNLRDTELKLGITMMHNSRFDLRSWYARKCQRANRLPHTRRPYRPIGQIYTEWIQFTLTRNIDQYYPNIKFETDNEARFGVYFYAEKPEDIIIQDDDLETTTILSKACLEVPDFNVVEWYRWQLNLQHSLDYNRHYTMWALDWQLQRTALGEETYNEFFPEGVLTSTPPGTDSTDSSTEMPALDEVTASETDSENDMPGLRTVTTESGDTNEDDDPQSEYLEYLMPEYVDTDEKVLEYLKSLPNSYENYDDNCSDTESTSDSPVTVDATEGQMEDVLGKRIQEILVACAPFPCEAEHQMMYYKNLDDRFIVERSCFGSFTIYDKHQGQEYYIHKDRLRNDLFSVGKWYATQTAKNSTPLPGLVAKEWLSKRVYRHTTIGSVLTDRMRDILQQFAPYPGDPLDYPQNDMNRFEVDYYMEDDSENIIVRDNLRDETAFVHINELERPSFNVRSWFYSHMLEKTVREMDFRMAWDSTGPDKIDIPTDERAWYAVKPLVDEMLNDHKVLNKNARLNLDVFGVQVDRNKFPALHRTSATPKDQDRIIPKPLIITVKVNGHPLRALIDSGSLGDFISSNTTDQLKLKKDQLEVPMSLQLAVQGSRSKVNHKALVLFEYQTIKEQPSFDIININTYDMILGTPWMYSHQVCIGLNPARVVIGSDASAPITHGVNTRRLAAQAVNITTDEIATTRALLTKLAKPLCKSMADTPLPPLRDINHTIPLIDPTKTYSWRPSRCPEAFRAQWSDKKDAYLKTGRWKVTAAGNSVPMLLIPKPGKKDAPPELRTVVDLRERNANTKKMTSPLPDIEGMLRRVASHRYRSLLDLSNAYEQTRITPEHVNRTTMTTPDGNMVSLVLQQGDCNAPATHQAVMNHIFSAHIGQFMDVYLDDIIIYSDSIEDHIRHVKIIFDILQKQQYYLSEKKLRFLEPEVKILGRIIDSEGIRMDPDKVDCVLNWKVPTNRDLLRGFLGSVGFLADDIPGIRIPMGVLSTLTGDTVPFRWSYTEQRAFDDIKCLTQDAREHRRAPMQYGNNAPPIWMVTDGCATGIAGVVSQGADWKTARVAAFYSAKLNPAQQNYPVHEVEMLAGIETMLRHSDILQGTHFTWITDHKGLVYLLNQKNLSGRQARWIEKISAFDFTVQYVPGNENVLADSLSRMYSAENPGTVRARSEYTYHDIVDDDVLAAAVMPILVGVEAKVASRRSERIRSKIAPAETGRPETSREFAKRMTGNFVLKGPKERKEGGDSSQKSQLPTTPSTKRSMATQTDYVAEEQPAHRPEPMPFSPLSLADMVSSSNAGIDLLSEVKNRYNNDTTFKKILENPKDFRNFTVEDGLIYQVENGSKLLCIPNIMIKGRSAREIVISEAHSLLAHLGAHKTSQYLRSHVWWKSMINDIKSYCDTCQTCRRSKPNNHKPYGPLNPLKVPTQPWEAIGIDFVGPLPVSTNRDGTFDSIAVVICLLTGMVHIIPTRDNYTAKDIAELMFEHVYKLHGLPKYIVSDRDVLFTSIFWDHLHKLVGTELRMSSAYHPQSDGATERANRTVTQMIRQAINEKQNNWVGKLPAIEFAINCAISESTGYSPFFLNNGRMPRPMIWDSAPATEYPAIRNFALQKKMAVIAAHDSILAARVKQTRNANRKRQTVPFMVNDLVYLSTENIKFEKGLAKKLIPKFIGPYKIIRDYGNYSFKLELPNRMKQRGIHDIFHSSLLRIHHPNDDRLFPGRMENQLGPPETAEGEWAVDKILSHSGSSRDALFEILWKSGDITWLPYDQISHLEHLKMYLEAMDVPDINQLDAGKGRPGGNDATTMLHFISYDSDLPTDYYKYSSSFSNSPSPITSAPSTSFCPSVRSPSSASRSTTHMATNEQYPCPDHPCLARPEFDTYLLLPAFATDHNSGRPHSLHIIRDYCAHDHFVRRLTGEERKTGAQRIPPGYDHFAAEFNQYTTGDAFFSVWSTVNHVWESTGKGIHFDTFFLPKEVTRGNRKRTPGRAPPHRQQSLISQREKHGLLEGFMFLAATKSIANDLANAKAQFRQINRPKPYENKRDKRNTYAGSQSGYTHSSNVLNWAATAGNVGGGMEVDAHSSSGNGAGSTFGGDFNMAAANAFGDGLIDFNDDSLFNFGNSIKTTNTAASTAPAIDAADLSALADAATANLAADSTKSKEKPAGSVPKTAGRMTKRKAAAAAASAAAPAAAAIESSSTDA